MSLLVVLLAWVVVLVSLGPWVWRYLSGQQRELEQRLIARLEDFHVFVQIDAVRRILLATLGGSLLIAAVVLQNLWAFPIVVIVVLLAVFAAARLRLARRFKQIRYQLPGVLELIATSLRAGLSIRSALLQVSRQAASPIAQDLAVLERMQRIGTPLETALSDWARRIPVSELALLGFAISVSSASGGSLSDSLERLATSFRQRLMLEEKVDALTAQGRLQAWVMAALPLLLALALTALDPASMAPLWTSAKGQGVLLLVIIFELLGLMWIRRLVQMKD